MHHPDLVLARSTFRVAMNSIKGPPELAGHITAEIDKYVSAMEGLANVLTMEDAIILLITRSEGLG